MWIGSTVYFLSDRDRVLTNLYSYEVSQGSCSQLTRHDDPMS